MAGLLWTAAGLVDPAPGRAEGQNSNEMVVSRESRESGETGISVSNLNQVFVEIASEVVPTVVSITGTRNKQKKESQEEAVIGMASGVIVSAEGYILTNNHVIDRAEKIKVRLNSGQSYEAAVIGTDPTTDLAVLKIVNLEPGARLPVVRFGDSDSVHIGEWVMAIGNPMALGLTVTAGIISAKSRRVDILSENPVNLRDNIDQSIESFLQTDAAINPGNSGGALVNTRGQVIGINTAIASRTGLYEGYGFAIPINLAQRVMEDLIKLGRVVRPVLGVLIQTVDPVLARALGMDKPQGVLVEDFIPKHDSPAQRGGLLRGDVIVAVDNKPVTQSHELQQIIAQSRPGYLVELTIIREKEIVRRVVKLGGREIEGRSVASSESPTSPKLDLLGMNLRRLTPEDIRELELESGEGVVVSGVDADGPAFRAGLTPGDVILEINRQKVNTLAEARESLERTSSGSVVLLMILRGGITNFIGIEVP